VPDESTVRLKIRYGDDESRIWEWYNEMEKNGRISRVRNLMLELAWEPKK
jgi:hypothetical protein